MWQLGCVVCRWQFWLPLLLLLTVGVSRSEAGGYPDIGDLNEFNEEELLAQVLRLADLPLFAQKGLLRVLGLGLVASDDLPCNIFGGVTACQILPPDSRIAQQCTGVNTQVDCAFWGEALQQADENPDEALRKRLAGLGHRPCQSCFEALHRFWCGQAVPKCGTFDKMLDKILPLISRVAKDDGDYEDALGEAIPDILRALSFGLPCREMCDAVTMTCGCGDPETFGEVGDAVTKACVCRDAGTFRKVLTSVHEEADRGSEASARAANMSYDTARKIFKEVWNTPICELFAREDTPGFHGVCDVPRGNSSPCDWCTAKRPEVQLVWQQMVAQVSQSVSSMMSAGLDRVMSPKERRWEGKRVSGKQINGKKDDDDDHDDDQDDDDDDDDDKKVRSGKKGRGHSLVWLWFVLPCAMAFFAGLGYASYYVYEKRYKFSGRKYVDLGDIGEEDDTYSPPML